MGFASKNAHSEPKFRAREWIADQYRHLSGNYSIPEDRFFVSLCNYQAPFGSQYPYPSEIVQQVHAGLITPQQYFGIDCGEWDKENKVWKKNIIEQNKKWHPYSQWRHGKWLDVLEDEQNIVKQASILHFDSTGHADGSAAKNAWKTATMITEPKTLLAVTSMLNDSYSRLQFDPDKLVNDFHNKVPSNHEWNLEVPRVRYSCAGKVDMMLCIFYKHS